MPGAQARQSLAPGVTETVILLMTTYGVVTICLNSADTLRRAAESVLGQTPAPRQYVFVDGGSTDATLDVVEDVIERGRHQCPDTAFLVLHQEPHGGGIPGAWNMGIEALGTDVVFLLNSDDWYEPDCASTVLDALMAPSDADILVAPINVCRDQGDTSPVMRRSRSFCLFPVLMPVMHPGCFVRRSVYERAGLFDERYRISADYDFLYRCYRARMRFVRLGVPLTNMLTGGLASRSRARARRETCAAGLRHCRMPLLPLAAYCLRAALRR